LNGNFPPCTLWFICSLLQENHGDNDFVASTKRFVNPQQTRIVEVTILLVTVTTVIVVVTIYIVTIEIITTTILVC